MIEEKIRRKTGEMQALEEKLKAAKVYIQALKDVLKAFDKVSSDESMPDATLRTGSSVAQARDVILTKRHPVHIDELLTELGKEVTRESKASLTGSLAAYVRKGEIFTRPAPSTFGLVELGHFETREEEEGPPKGFGSTVPSDLDEEIPF
jgi:hypothetical protein